MKKISLATVLLCSAVSVSAGEWRGNITTDYHWFVNDGVYPTGNPQQASTYTSASIEPEYFHDWNSGYDLFTFKAFARLDLRDDERTHSDIRELSYLHAGEDWEVLLGIGKVFWGVTESIHLVDIINQSDTVENLDGEDKLGQPMLQYTLIKDWGTLSTFVLPGFRERTFPGIKGRPRFGLVIDTDNPVYEDADEDKHIDFAMRYAHYIGDWEFSLSHFYGTSREPRLQINAIGAPSTWSISPVYDIINQTGLTLQANIGSWLWKLEAISRSGTGQDFTAAASGFEYTFVGVFGSNMDVGMIMEYLYDERDSGLSITPGSVTTVNPALFQNDLTIGARLTFNDADSSEILASVIGDLDGDGLSYNIEASTRVDEAVSLSIEARGVSDPAPGTALDQLSEDNRVRVELAYYF